MDYTNNITFLDLNISKCRTYKEGGAMVLANVEGHIHMNRINFTDNNGGYPILNF